MAESQSTVAPLADRPLVTFALISYNQEKYIRAAIEGAFSQTYEPLEIILSDDCSTDQTYEIMNEMARRYKGSHRVICNRNASNLGLIGHVNLINDMARGDLVVVAAGDDISMPERTSEHVQVYISNRGRVHSVHSSVIKIDRDGKELGLWRPPILATNSRAHELVLNFAGVIGASQSWSRILVKKFGPIRNPNTYEDLVISFRSSLLEGIHYIDKPLVRYRFGVGLSTSELKEVNELSAICRSIDITKHMIHTLSQREADCTKLGRNEFKWLFRKQKAKLHIKVLWLRTRYFLATYLRRQQAEDQSI